jgi:tyrosyl-tRNA synthetase
VPFIFMTDLSATWAWLERGTQEIFPDRHDSSEPQENLRQLLQTIDRPLRIKLGIDPTGTDIHLGHSIPFRKLRAFQDQGHTAVVIIGDFTAQIGDPTGKSSVRQQLSAAQVRENAQNYLAQLQPILDFVTPGRLEIRYNSEWLARLDLAQIQELLATMTVGQMLAKEGFAERFGAENPIFLHEFLYPLLQGYDSVQVKADVELGGTDQKFNIAVGRDLQKYFGQKPQFGLLLPILIGTDGVQKMSKSLHNYVGLREDPLAMYSKLEKVPDALLPNYFELLTNLEPEAIAPNPRQAQKQLALEITGQFHGASAAQTAQATAEAIVMAGKATNTEAVPEYSLAALAFPVKAAYLLGVTGLCPGSSEGRRQIQGGSVRLDGDRLQDTNQTYASPQELVGKVLQVGKKKFIRFVP